MNRIAISTALTLAAATPFTLHGQNSSETDYLNRFSLGARLGLNFKAAFRNNAPGIPGNPGANIGTAIGGADHSYDDGYVKVDTSGNAGGLTSNWGYQNGSQVAGDTMQFHSTESSLPSAAANNKVTGDPQYGVELIYQRLLGTIPATSSMPWGLEAAFGYTDLDLSDERNATGLVTMTTDTFQLNGVLPPGAGYNGPFAGAGALLGDVPTRSTASDTATMASHHRLSGQLLGFRLGPFAEWNFTPKLSLAASAGLALAPTSVEYDFSETATLAGSVTSVATSHSSKTALLYGYYVSALLRCDLNKRWGVYAGAQFQSLNDLELSVGSRSARLDPGATVYGTVGATWHF